jgi:hypothetical protein
MRGTFVKSSIGSKFYWRSKRVGEAGAGSRERSRKTPTEPAPPPVHFRLTPEGRDFLRDVRAKVGAGDGLDWTRADEIDFSRL